MAVVALAMVAAVCATSCGQATAGGEATQILLADADALRCTARVSLEQDTLFLCGSISAEMASAVSRLSTDSLSAVVVTSLGGDPVAAVEIANTLALHEKTLVVRGVCASACAHVFAMGAGRLVLDPQSVILVHHSTSYMLRALETVGYDPVDPMVVRGADAERTYYDARRLDHRFLYAPQILLGTRCVWQDEREANGSSQIAFQRAALMMPTRAAFEAARGTVVEGEWPQTAEAIHAALSSAVFEESSQISIAAGWPRALTDEDFEQHFSTLERCSL